MKKLIFAISAAIALLSSCATKEIEAPVISPEKGVYSINASIATRATIDGEGNLSWGALDSISVYDGIFEKFTHEGESGAVATFQGELYCPEEVAFALCPHGIGGEVADEMLTVNLPVMYSYDGTSTHAPMIATGFKVENNSATIAFKHIGGLFKVTYSNIPEEAKYFYFESTDKQISGEFFIEDYTVDNPVIEVGNDPNDGSMVFYDLGENHPSTMSFYVPVPVGTFSFSVSLRTKNGIIDGTSRKKKDFTVERGSYIEIPEIVINNNTDLHSVEHTISWTGPSDWTDDNEKDEFSLTAQPYGYSVVLKKNNGGTSPTVNATAKDCRLYAKGTATISNSKEITKIIFNISTAGKKRLAPITASIGTIAPQASGDETVVWTGKAKEITFTVGDNANYGSEGSSKAGQLCFDTIDATYLSDGSEPEPEPTKYTITIAEGIVGGTVTASAAEAVENTEITLTATPATGYDFSSWNVINAATSAEITVTDNKFTMPAANVNVSANFRKQTTGEVWTATAFASILDGDELVIVGNNGDTYAMSNDNGTSNPPDAVSVTISGDDLANTPESEIIWVAGKDNGNIIFYQTDAKENWLYCTATNNGVRVGTNTNKAFTLDDSGYLKHNGTSRFVGIYNSADWRCYTSSTATNIVGQSFKFYVRKGGATKYSVTCETVTGGTLSASSTKAEEGATVTLTATPSAEYTFNNDWTVTGADETPITVTDGKFTMPAQNVTVSGSFTQKTYAITKTPATNGTYTVKVSDAEVETAVKGAKITLAAEPAEGYKFDGFTVKETISGKAVTVSNNAFTMPGAAVTISAAFSEKPVGPTYEGSGTEADPYTINDAYMLIDGLGTDTSEEVCVKGTIYQVDSYNNSYNSITYWIGSSEKPLEVYGGLNLKDATPFASKDDLNIGDEVVVKGKLKNYNGTYEFTSNNYLVSIKKAPYLKATASKTSGIAAAGETITVTVDTNVDGWTANSDNAAFTISGITATSFNVVVSANTTTSERTAKITVSATGVNPVEITLKQDKSGGKTKDNTAKYTLTPTAGSNNSYTGNCDVTVGGITWNVTGNAQQVPWRIGGKSISNVDRAVYSKTAYSKELWKVSLTVGAASSITVNSLKLIYSANADFSNSQEISGTFKDSSTIDFEAEFPANCYYKFVFNVSVSATSNKFVEFSKVEFFGYQGE